MTMNQQNLGSRLRVRAELWGMVKKPERDELGQVPIVPEKQAELWCSVVPQTGGLLTGRPAETKVARTTHKVIVRWRPGLTPEQWLVIRGQRYAILYILDPYLRRETLELFCEVLDDGSRV